ncbi:glycosyltransferase family 2 protein [Desulfobacter vibrioformis]|uniref:glycosyltransferase family 2 protein n=1 Tax=Desulfobacter vibrioformis TaxID=34031 RepID=UPI00068F2302|nr:glycosyltransferase family 2 protein [Desulfobacter vibrioformis]
MADITIIILSYNTKTLLLNCLESVFDTTRELDVEVVVVDNASCDGSPDAVKAQFPEVHVIENRYNLGFAKANNIALGQVTGKYALLLNSDTRLTPGAVKALYDFMEKQADAGVACGQLLNEDGSKQNSFAYFPGFATLLVNESLINTLSPFRKSKRSAINAPVKVDSCIGACILLRMSAVAAAGFLDEAFFFFFEETDLALTMRQKGWFSYMVPQAGIYHFQGQSVGHSIKSRQLFYQSRKIYYNKHFPLLSGLYMPLVLCRLAVDFLLNFILSGLAFLRSDAKKNKAALYYKLLIWHAKGCPQTDDCQRPFNQP